MQPRNSSRNREAGPAAGTGDRPRAPAATGRGPGASGSAVRCGPAPAPARAGCAVPDGWADTVRVTSSSARTRPGYVLLTAAGSTAGACRPMPLPGSRTGTSRTVFSCPQARTGLMPPPSCRGGRRARRRGAGRPGRRRSGPAAVSGASRGHGRDRSRHAPCSCVRRGRGTLGTIGGADDPASGKPGVQQAVPAVCGNTLCEPATWPRGTAVTGVALLSLSGRRAGSAGSAARRRNARDGRYAGAVSREESVSCGL